MKSESINLYWQALTHACFNLSQVQQDSNSSNLIQHDNKISLQLLESFASFNKIRRK